MEGGSSRLHIKTRMNSQPARGKPDIKNSMKQYENEWMICLLHTVFPVPGYQENLPVQSGSVCDEESIM